VLVWTSHILLGFSPRIESDQYEKERPLSRKSTAVSARVLSMRYRISIALESSLSLVDWFVCYNSSNTYMTKGHGLIIHCSIGSPRLDSRRRRHPHEEELQMGKGKTEVTSAPQYSYLLETGGRAKEVILIRLIIEYWRGLSATRSLPNGWYDLLNGGCSRDRGAEEEKVKEEDVIRKTLVSVADCTS